MVSFIVMTCKQCLSDPTEQSFAPTVFQAKVSLTYSTISKILESLAYCNDDMQTVSQRPDRTELRPNSVPSKSVSYIFNYFQSSRVSSFPYRSPLICSFGRRRLVYITDRCTYILQASCE